MTETPQKLSVNQIKQRVVSSFMSLTFRQIALRAIRFLTINIILASKVTPATLGVFNLATAVVSFFSFFADIGLAASLIQKKEAVTDEDIRTTFTVQEILVGAVSLLVIIFAPAIAKFYQLDDSGAWLIRVLGITFFLSSLKVIPSVLLERELKFKPLVTIDMVEAVVFNGLLIVLVFQGLDLWSFSIAQLLASVAGVIAIYLIAPVKLRFGIVKASANQLLTFGLPYQFNSLLALLKDRLVPLVIARMVGTTGVGYITWAQGMAYLPLEIMSSIIRLTFPAFSRLQDDKVALGKALEKSLFVTSLTVYPALFGIAALLPSVVSYVVLKQWQPSIPSFYLFAFSTFWAVISTTFTNALNAIGEIKTTLKLMIFWTTITWLLTPLLVWQFGFVGVGLSSFLISFTSVITIILVKRILEVKVLEAISLPLICSAIMGLTVYLFSESFVRSKLSLVVAIALGGLIYSGLIWLFGKQKVLNEVKDIRHG